MPSHETPLRGHEVFQTANAADLCRELERVGARCVVVPSATRFDACARRYALPSSAIWFGENHMPLRIEVPDGPYIRMQIQRAGAGVTWLGGQSIDVNATQSCISRGAAILEHGSGFQQLSWQVRHDVLVRRLAALTGSPVTRKLQFDPVCRRSRPESHALIAILNCILANIEHATVRTPSVLAGLEDALMISLLFNFPHSLRDLLEQEVPAAGSWQVRRVEEYIEAHLDAPFNIEQIAAVTGISTRSIYRAFKRSRGYSPMAFARQRRLQRARRLLEDREQMQTVTSVAFVCGFNDVGHFSREFSKAFGESPSAVLSR
jgi:AraC-like DNA-binding protein